MGLKLEIESDSITQTAVDNKVVVPPDAPLADVLQSMRDLHTGNAMVVEDGKLIGIFTERDALKLMADGDSFDRKISDVMTAPPVTLQASDSVAAAIKMMSEGGYRRLPVVDDQGATVGCVKVSGIMRYLVEHFPSEVYNLPPDPNQKNKEREGA